jgi:ribonucleoside-diphosphate reductase subunit M1
MMATIQENFVIKRNGQKEPISFDKILKRCKSLGREGLNVNYTQLVQKIIDRVFDGITTAKIDELLAQQCASLSTTHYDYGLLASRILISNHHKNTDESYLNVINKLYKHADFDNNHSPLISEQFYRIATQNIDEIQSWINYDNDFLLDYFGFKTLERAYLMKIKGIVVERPQHMWMRVALGIHGENLTDAKESYEMLSKLYFTHATPTLFNCGTPHPQMSSCYLLAMEKDSIDGIYKTLHDCASISKWAGGIGLHIHNVRAKTSHIRGTNGTSNGIVPMLRVFNETARYVDQGGGKRAGSFAIYLEPWHADIFDFLDLKKNHGDENARARDLFYAMWIPDLFMERVRDDLEWTLMCPDKCKGLSDAYGENFKELYESYEKQNKGNNVVKAREIWFKILSSQAETGVPYMLYKDAANSKSNQKNLGTIKSSNLCCEIMEYSNNTETAVCNLASIALSKCIKYKKIDMVFEDSITVYTKDNCNWCVLLKGLLKQNNISFVENKLTSQYEFDSFFKKHNVNTLPQLFDGNEICGGYDKVSEMLCPYFDYPALHKITKMITNNLNKVIDLNFYPTKKTSNSNFKHRPIGIGVQGLADTFAILNIPFHSKEALEINKRIFETIYHAALEKSMELSEINGAYTSFKGSPASRGILQFDMWNVSPSKLYDWDKLKLQISENGLRNSLLVAPMPTASTSQILGNNECFEPFTSNIYLRRTLAGEFVIINKHLLKELTCMGLWNNDIKNEIIKNNGSIQDINGIPKKTKEKYKIVWEIPMKHIIDMAADRGAFIDQSQSMNLWMKNPDAQRLTKMHFYSWKKGLKTGLYYLRTKAKASPQQFTIEPDKKSNYEEEDDCLMCGS